MCGLFGVWGEDPRQEHFRKNFAETLQELKHRGPDKQSFWSFDDLNLTLGHTRLAIQDLSMNGNQPMKSSDGRFILCFNGEIYNHLKIRHGLKEDGFLPPR